MAGVLGLLIRPQKRPVGHHSLGSVALELETAKEILAEVFMVRLSDVDEMIQNRFDKVSSQEVCGEENGLWPQEFWLD
jgi:hypothetical protein